MIAATCGSHLFFSFVMDLGNYEDCRRSMVIQSLTNERKRKVSVADLRVSRRLYVYDSRHNYGSGTFVLLLNK